LDDLESVIEEAKKWIPRVKRPPFAGLDSVPVVTIEQTIAKSKTRSRLKKSLLNLLAVYNDSTFPDELLRERFRTLITEWAKENDGQLSEYLTLLYRKKFALMNYVTTRDPKWLAHFYRKVNAIEEFEKEYRPASNVMKFWNWGL